jgi:hypothetical protein
MISKISICSPIERTSEEFQKHFKEDYTRYPSFETYLLANGGERARILHEVLKNL